MAALQTHVNQTGSVAGFKDAEEISDRAQFWAVDCDILVPAALEQKITVENASSIRAKIILEGANGPTSPAADTLHENGVLVVPDVIANAGRVASVFLPRHACP